MNESSVYSSLFRLQNAQKTLNMSIKSCFAAALVGQWVFASYIFIVYIITLANGLDAANFSPAPNFKNSQGLDRFLFLTHIIPAIYLSLFGLFQMVPKIRNRFRRFHRWNGRIFLILGFSGAATGLYLQWLKGLQTNFTASFGITLNGLLILVATYLTWRYAINKRFDLHMRWAVHTFVLVNGVWLFRLYLMGWYMVNQGPNGNTNNVDGPVDIFLSFACYAVPMLMAEIYFWANKQRSGNKVWGASLIMVVGTLITTIGVSAAVVMMWAPRIAKALNAL